MKTHRFFNNWTLRRLQSNKGKLTPEIFKAEKEHLMALPHAQRVAQIAGNARRLFAWRRSCEQANAIAKKKSLARLGIA